MAEQDFELIDAGELAVSRAAAYRFLSTAYFEEVSCAFLESMRDGAAALDGELASFANDLAGADLESVRIDLAADFSRMFLGMSRSPIAPYESVYASDMHMLMQEPRDEVLHAYRAEGFAVADDVRVPEDHVAFEFEFMAKLCERAAEALATGDEDAAKRCFATQGDFVQNHLVNWVFDLCTDVSTRARTPFYRGVAELTRAFLESEHSYLSGAAGTVEAAGADAAAGAVLCTQP